MKCLQQFRGIKLPQSFSESSQLPLNKATWPEKSTKLFLFKRIILKIIKKHSGFTFCRGVVKVLLIQNWKTRVLFIRSWFREGIKKLTFFILVLNCGCAVVHCCTMSLFGIWVPRQVIITEIQISRTKII